MAERLQGPRITTSPRLPGGEGQHVTTTDSGLAVVRKRVHVYDTTLRDGQQDIEASYSVKGKLLVANAIDRILPVSVIEGGWPGANPTDTKFFAAAKDQPFHTKLAAFGMTRRAGVNVEDDTNINTLINSEAPYVTLVGKTDVMHVDTVFKIPREENLAMIEDSVRYARENGRRVIYDAEHFFDGAIRNPEYAMETIRAAARGGAEAIALCDTNGGRMPWEIEEWVTKVMNDEQIHRSYRENYKIIDPEEKIQIGIHTHADRRMAEANALYAVKAGATQVQGTVMALGERSGNADILVISDALNDMGVLDMTDEQRASFVELGGTVSKASGVDVSPRTQLIGKNAFATKAGMHQDAMIKNRDAYNFKEPRLYGNDIEIYLNSQSGKRAVLAKAEELGVAILPGSAAEITQAIKEREDTGYRYARAEGSLDLLLRKFDPGYEQPFDIDFKDETGETPVVLIPDRQSANGHKAFVAVPFEVHEKRPNGMFETLKDTLIDTYPELGNVHYERELSDGENGTKRVFVRATNGETNWTTVGIGPTYELASLEATAQAIEYALCHPRQDTDIA